MKVGKTSKNGAFFGAICRGRLGRACADNPNASAGMLCNTGILHWNLPGFASILRKTMRNAQLFGTSVWKQNSGVPKISSLRLASSTRTLFECPGRFTSTNLAALGAIRAERINTAKAVAASAIVGAKAQLAKCVLAADLIPTPGNVAAAAKCMGWYSLTMAGIITALNRATDDINNDYGREVALLRSEAGSRERQYEILRDRSLKIERVRNEFQTGLIASDLEHCISRVTNN